MDGQKRRLTVYEDKDEGEYVHRYAIQDRLSRDFYRFSGVNVEHFVITHTISELLIRYMAIYSFSCSALRPFGWEAASGIIRELAQIGRVVRVQGALKNNSFTIRNRPVTKLNGRISDVWLNGGVSTSEPRLSASDSN